MSDTWVIEPRSFAAWNTERTGSTERITEAGNVRVTEQGNVRIIEFKQITWTNEMPSFNPWTPASA